MNNSPALKFWDTTDVPNLNDYTVGEACMWLIHKLDLHNNTDVPYSVPYVNYVLTWPDAIPVKAVVLMQSPYPNSIFPCIAAAMSYSTDLCIQRMGRAPPPTVDVLANDLVVNAGADRQACIDTLKDGWRMVAQGVLLVNESVLSRTGTRDASMEAEYQSAVIRRLLTETEKYGKCTVDLLVMGDAGDRVAGKLTSGFKSRTVKLSRHKVSHPASLSYRYSDLRDPSCHLDTPSFSKLMWKYISNQVALEHTMPPKKNTEQEVLLRTQSSILSNVRGEFPALAKSLQEFIELQQTVEMNTKVSDEEYKAVLKRIVNVGDLLANRLAIAGAMVTSVDSVSSNKGGAFHVSKPGPSLTAVAPSPAAVAQHVGKPNTVSPPTPVKAIKASFGRKSSASPQSRLPSVSETTGPVSQAAATFASPHTVGESTLSGSSTPPAQRQAPGVAPSTKLTFKSRTPSRAPSSASVLSAPSSNVSNNGDAASEASFVEVPTSPTPLPVRNLFKSLNVSKPASRSASPAPSKYGIAKDVLLHLSGVEAVVLANGADGDDQDVADMLSSIQNDIQFKTVYNDVVRQLIPCIEEDMKNIPKFEFAEWAVNPTDSSATYRKCKELFKF